MRKIVYCVAMSLDGYVAGPNGEADWIVMDPEIDFRGTMARFDTILMGRRTFEAAQAMGGGAAMPTVHSFVVSRTLRQEDHPNVKVIAEDLGGAVSRLRAGSGKDILLFGGGILFCSLLDLRLVDAIEVGLIPVLLGSGVPLLPERSGRVGLRLLSSKTYKATGTMGLEYAIDRGA
ncbi:MAG: dihydrofolate reductase family protein [Acidobacteriota bacterium]